VPSVVKGFAHFREKQCSEITEISDAIILNVFVMATSTVISAPRVNRITGAVISGAMNVHSHLGPGLLESAYEACLAHELRKLGIRVAQQVGRPVIYDGECIDLGYRIDLIIEDLVIVKIKNVEAINPVHQAQLLSYIRLSGSTVGLLINFHVAHLRDGIKKRTC
jgi:GxxExxY protein